MNKILSIKIVAIGSIILMSSLFTQVVSANQIDTTNTTDVLIKKIMEKRKIPGLQLAIVKNGEIIKLQGYGEANLQHAVKVTNQTVFPINSMTKAFTGVAVMQLVEQGKLRLDDTIGKHLPELPTSWHYLTIEQLLANTSGLPKIMSGRGTELIANNDPEDAWDLVQTLPLEFKANSQFSYNQTGYVILGIIINKLAKENFTAFITQHQFSIVNMPLTEQAGFTNMQYVVPNQASQYGYGRDGKLNTRYIAYFPYFRTAAGMSSTAKELADYVIALQKGNLLNKSSLESLWTPITLNNGRTAGFSSFENGYAMGWQVEKRKAHRGISASGANANTLIIYPEDNLSIVVLTNLLGSLPIQFVDEIASIYIADMKKENGWKVPLDIWKQQVAQKGFKNIAETTRKVEEELGVYFNHNNINAWGYELLGQKNLEGALAVFILNTEIHPDVANTFDSLGETYGTLKQYPEALVNYQQVLLLQPNNESARKKIKYIKELINN